MQDDVLLIGLDGGATKISGWQVVFNPETKLFSLGNLHAEKSYKEIPGYIPDFEPIDIKMQLKEREEGAIRQTAEEIQQEAVYVEACAAVIERIVSISKSESVIIGLGMPGLKTNDRRGISVVANGPRMIRYSDLLEERLTIANIELSHPVAHIGSDADYCGIGENYADAGLFREVQNAYYLGGGTGVADALKLHGQLLPFDLAREWIAKSWEMKTSEDKSLERYASAGGIQSLYSEKAGITVKELNEKQIYPLQMADFAADGDKDAIHTFEKVATHLADLILERIVTVYSGWKNQFTFVNPNKPALTKEHPYQKTLLERIIIGQRLGELIDSENGNKVLKQPLSERFQHRLQSAKWIPDEIKTYYAEFEKFLFTSKLREAPALGAGIDAHFAINKD